MAKIVFTIMIAPALKIRTRPFLLSLLMLASVTMIVFGQMPGDSLLWGELQNTGHTVLFILITLTFMGVLHSVLPYRYKSSIAAYTFAFLVLVALAMLTETGQQMTGREPSFADVVRDIAGIIIGLAVYAYADPAFVPCANQHCRTVKRGMLVCSVFLLVLSLFPIINLAIAYIKRDQAFPTIVDFEAGWAMPFLELNQAVLIRIEDSDKDKTGRVSSTGKAVMLNLNPGDYPGFAVIEPYPDWSAYSVLDLDLYSTHDRIVDVMLRIHDNAHNQEHIDRFNRVLRLEPGHNSFRVPLREVRQAPANREMNMQHVSGVELFALDIDDSVDLYPGAVTLR